MLPSPDSQLLTVVETSGIYLAWLVAGLYIAAAELYSFAGGSDSVQFNTNISTTWVWSKKSGVAVGVPQMVHEHYKC